ncbi:MAG: peptidase M16 [Deltaproteobacteria bacterium]|nr:MAG: peptidase M16 [Deltaproteobacteria bacterium]
MTHGTDRLNPDLAAGKTAHGFTVLRTAALEIIDGFLYELRHGQTGAQYIHISRPDKENVFGVAFKTVPEDSSGVAHILEHTVLCGSARFPVRDPFFSMLKRSLSTFMNAFTASDWTMYPFATQNRKDFRNLMDVYLDAAFFPNIDELSFKQEGHRIEFDDTGAAPSSDRLVYKGIVLNEMKGAMSSPDQVMVRSLLNALYPDTTYRFNSGGEPADIPRLTHAQLVSFHQRHYHPSNAFFYTYGDMPLAEHLAFINNTVLTHFDRIDPGTEVPGQPRWSSPRQVAYPYPLAEGEDPKKKYQACVAWLSADIQNTFDVLVLTLLEHILLGNPASPLRKALIESGIGSALSDGTGLDTDNRDIFFACGLKDIKKDDDERVETIIFDCLNDLVENGIDIDLIESAIHQVEFHRREITSTPFPYGLKLLMQVASTWFHGGSPERILRFDEEMDRIRQSISRGGFFEKKLRTWFLDNPHRVRFVLIPDPQMARREAEREAAELSAIIQQLSDAEKEKIRDDTRALAARQAATEDISILPTLEIEDIPTDIVQIQPTDIGTNTRIRGYGQSTSGILYYLSAAGIGHLDPDLLPYLPFFCHALTRVGTTRHDYVAMARQIDRYTGGIALSIQARTRFDETGACLPMIQMSGKSLDRNREPLFDIVDELVGETRFSDLARLKTLLLEYRAALEAMVIQNGHQLAISLASRTLSPTGALNETFGGIHHLRAIKALSDQVAETDLANLSEKLTRIRKLVFQPENMKTALIGKEEVITSAAQRLKARYSLSDAAMTAYRTDDLEGTPLPREGWYTASAVSFVAQAFKTVRMGHEDAPALTVIAKMLRSLYLHREIREKGGAYGGFAAYNTETGIFAMASYRDPHIVATLNAFEGANAYICTGEFKDEDIKEAILQVCSDIDKPDPPGPAARKAFFRSLVSLTDERRLAFKQSLLALTRQRVIDTANVYFNSSGTHRAVAVISGKKQLEAANTRLGDQPLTLFAI